MQNSGKHALFRCLYIPGRGQHNAMGIGAILRDNGWEVIGPDLDLKFCSQPFDIQVREIYSWVRLVQKDQVQFIANSYGAYLLMHSWMLYDHKKPRPMFSCRNTALFFSPVTGSPPAQISSTGVMMSRLPRNKALLEAISFGTFPSPPHIIMHMGEDDPLIKPAIEVEKAGNGKFTLITVSGKGHNLGEEYQRMAIQESLGRIPIP